MKRAKRKDLVKIIQRFIRLTEPLGHTKQCRGMPCVHHCSWGAFIQQARAAIEQREDIEDIAEKRRAFRKAAPLASMLLSGRPVKFEIDFQPDSAKAAETMYASTDPLADMKAAKAAIRSGYGPPFRFAGSDSVEGSKACIRCHSAHNAPGAWCVPCGRIARELGGE